MAQPPTILGLADIPAVSTLLQDPQVIAMEAELGPALVRRAVRDVLAEARAQIQRTGSAPTPGPDQVRQLLASLTEQRLRRVLNATGVIVHTNLGRAPLAQQALDAIQETAGGYSNLEYDLNAAHRGDRHAHVSQMLAELVGAEAALAFNNCAGAVLVMLAALCKGKEVIVSRSELVEIGGGFRIPDVMKASGATLVEVGTTNKTYVSDYERAITENTAGILHVHRSNFAIVGFVRDASFADLAGLAKKKGILMLADLGSGLVIDSADLLDSADALSDEPRPKNALVSGADVVAFSGDKLMGGPQAGIVVGNEGPIDLIRKDPLARAIRIDKLSLAALEATLHLVQTRRFDDIPVLRMLRTSTDALSRRAHDLADRIRTCCAIQVSVVPGECVPGGGSSPLAKLPTFLVLLGRPEGTSARLQRALAMLQPPLLTRIVDDCVAVDVRTIDPRDLGVIAAHVATAATHVVN